MVLRRTCSLWKLDVLAIALTPSSIAILLQANDWTFLYDLEGQLQFPIEAAVTSLRPDVVLFSPSSKTIVLLELTVPLEDNVHQAHDRKTTKYSALVTPCEENGFKTHMFALEVGCLGYCPHSFLHCHSSSSEWLDISVRSRRPATVSNRSCCNVSKARCGVIFSFKQDNRPPGADSSSRGQCPPSSWQKNNQILCLSHGLRRKWF